jgi:hypothetical protein
MMTITKTILKKSIMRNWINKNRRGIELAIVLLLLVSKEWTLAIVLGIVWGLEDEETNK